MVKEREKKTWQEGVGEPADSFLFLNMVIVELFHALIKDRIKFIAHPAGAGSNALQASRGVERNAAHSSSASVPWQVGLRHAGKPSVKKKPVANSSSNIAVVHYLKPCRQKISFIFLHDARGSRVSLMKFILPSQLRRSISA